MKADAPILLAVDFDGSDVTNSLYIVDSYTYFIGVHPTVSSNYHCGQPVYHAFHSSFSGVDVYQGSASLTIAEHVNDSWEHGGIRLQWNGPEDQTDLWHENDVATALCLFKKEDFLNGLDSGKIRMDAANDTLRAEVEFQPKNPACLKSAAFRWVIQDGSTFYISQATDFTAAAGSETRLTSEAKEITWYAYDPEEDIRAVLKKASPLLRDIRMIGFRMEAVCAANSAERQYQNFRVNSFSAMAINPANAKRRR